MFNNVIGDWPTHERFILTSCDEKYFNRYFPRFYKTFTKKWQLPIHVHVIDPSQKSLERLDRLGVSHTYCQTDDNILKWPYSYETYCQAQRFILLGHRLLDTQSVVVADVDAYALKEPSEDHKQTLFKDMAFTTFNDRLMATFCHFHSKRKKQALLAAETMTDNITQTDMIGVDQKVIKQFFKKLPYTELKNNVWIRHMNVKTEKDKLEHLKCLVYHEKGTRGKIKTVETTWTDIE
tara:strand:- start:98 stop:805 length:708 start_codon:yes stop_codon:yes gene_type:complete